MTNQKNISQVQDITKRLNEAQAVYLVDYQGLPVNDLNELRNQIRQVNGELAVVKNTLFLRALRAVDEKSELKVDNPKLELQGTTAALYADDDQVEPLKVTVKYAKDHELPKLKAGILNHRILNTEDVIKLSKLPGLTELRGQMVGMLQSPISRLVFGLKGNLQKLVIALSEIQKQKVN